MKIKTKRGARRVRSQLVIDKKFVITDYANSDYFDAGVPYKVISLNGGKVENKYGIISSVMIGKYSHLEDAYFHGIGKWKFLTK